MEHFYRITLLGHRIFDIVYYLYKCATAFSVNTCLILAVITLYYCPSQGHNSFAFVFNFEKVLSFDRCSYFAHFFLLSSLFPLFTILFFVTIVFIILKIGIVSIISVFFLTLVYFVCSVTWWCACSMPVILYDLFFMPICCFCH